MSLPTDSAARKRIPMYTGLLVYFPDALAAVAQHSFDNNEKHNPGELLHWSREKSSDHLNCCVRHLTDIATGADKIEELKALAWRALAELQLTLEAQAVKPKTERNPEPSIDWVEWNGGALCPLPIKGMWTEVKLRDGDSLLGPAEHFRWRHENYPSDIVAYRLAK